MLNSQVNVEGMQGKEPGANLIGRRVDNFLFPLHSFPYTFLKIPRFALRGGLTVYSADKIYSTGI